MKKQSNNNKLRIKLNVQIESLAPNIPDRNQLRRWVRQALWQQQSAIELTIRIVDEKESAKLNQTYRHKRGPTNVLTFTYDNSHHPSLYLGDIVICAPLVAKEAIAQQKSTEAHWAHLTIHGILHLLGYDHLEEKEAQIMELLEITLLKQLDYSNPYQ